MYSIDVGFVLSKIKYRDTDVILNCYNLNSGKQSFIFRGYYKRKQNLNALTFPLSHLEFKFKRNNRSELKNLIQIQSINYWRNTYNKPIKSGVILFLSEILSSVLKEETSNTALFNFILEAVKVFDRKKENYADFHLWFLLNLTKFLGFNPNQENWDSEYFDLTQGVFINDKMNTVIQGSELNLFKRLVRHDFNLASKNIFNKNERGEVMDIILRYYQLHVDEFRFPKSLNVLKEILS